MFVHGWWRASTTWFWAKLRGRPGLRCYYEPLHERVGMLTPEWLRRMRPNPEGLRSAGHPQLTEPYFAEFGPLLAAGGTGFVPELSYRRYLLLPEEPDPALERYLQRLVSFAGERGERPVLCFVRSSLRALWMRRRFDAVHLAQLRDAREQWGSFLGQGDVNYYSLGTLLAAGSLHARVPKVLSHIETRDFPRIGIVARRGTLSMTPPGMPDLERQYAVFVLLWLAGALQSLSAADLVLDCNRIAQDAALRARLESELAAAGVAADLSDVAPPSHRQLPLPDEKLEEIEAAAIRQLAGDARPIAIFERARVGAALDQLAPGARRLLESALAAL